MPTVLRREETAWEVTSVVNRDSSRVSLIVDLYAEHTGPLMRMTLSHGVYVHPGTRCRWQPHNLVTENRHFPILFLFSLNSTLFFFPHSSFLPLLATCSSSRLDLPLSPPLSAGHSSPAARGCWLHAKNECKGNWKDFLSVASLGRRRGRSEMAVQATRCMLRV